MVGIKEATKDSFEEHGLSEIIQKIIFIGSDGALVNTRKNSGLSSYFRTIFHMYNLFGVSSIGWSNHYIQCIESLYGSHRHIFNASILFI